MENQFDELYKSKYMSISYDSGLHILKNSWLKRNIPDDIAKEELYNWVKYFEKLNPSFLITNLTGGYLIVPEMQEWMAHFLHPIVSKVIKKWAFVMHSDIFSSLSVQMAVDVISELGFEQKYFDMNDEEAAMSWLRSN